MPSYDTRYDIKMIDISDEILGSNREGAIRKERKRQGREKWVRVRVRVRGKGEEGKGERELGGSVIHTHMRPKAAPMGNESVARAATPMAINPASPWPHRISRVT